VKEKIKIMKKTDATFSGTTDAFAIAWVCDRFLTDEYFSKESFLPAEAISVIGKFRIIEASLPKGSPEQAHVIMQCVAEVVPFCKK